MPAPARPAPARLALPLLIALAAAGCNAAASAPAVTIADPWARATAPGQSSGAAYLTLTSASGDRLVGVSSPMAKASLHESMAMHRMAGMAPLTAIELPAGQPVDLAPGGTHVMLTGLTRPLAVGDTVPLTLDFATAPDQTVLVAVVDPASR